MMKNIALQIEYDGTLLHGWQSQKNHRNVQDEIQLAILKCTGEQVKLIGCSRTDACVHATGHVSNFFSETKIPINKLPLALNSHLPPDISVQCAAIVPDSFHARFDAIGKQYRYKIYCSPTRPALNRNREYHITRSMDINLVKIAAQQMEGTHDFRAFMASGGEVKTTVRTIYSIEIEQKGPEIDIVVHGNGFLYNMVRIIAGTLYYIGCGKIQPESIASIIDSGDRKLAGKTLPAHGLFLEEVFYETKIFSDG